MWPRRHAIPLIFEALTFGGLTATAQLYNS